MKKLRLDLNALAVESFQPHAASHTCRGTVAGHADPFSSPETACADTCQTAAYTCATCPPDCEPQDGEDRERRIILF